MLRSVFLEFSHLSMVQLCSDSSLCIDIRLQLYLDLQTQVKTVLHPQYDQHNQTIFHETPLNMWRYRKAVASALWLQLALVACYKPLGVVEALFTQIGQPSLIFSVRQLQGHWFLAQLYTQTEHSCGYYTLCSGVLFYPRLSILCISYNLFLENSHFLVSPSTSCQLVLSTD